MRKVFSLLLVFTIILVMPGCGKSDKAALQGTWEGEFELADALNADMADEADPENADFFQVSSFKIKLRLVFNSDDTYSMILDESVMPQLMEGFKQDLSTGVEHYLEALIAEEGLDMSLEEFVEISGFTMDKLLDQVSPQGTLESLVMEMTRGIERSGKYRANNGKLYMTNGMSQELDDSSFDNYILDGNTLTLVAAAQDMDEVTDALYPMVFHKVS